MTDLLRIGSDWLEDQRTKHLSRMVIYQRGVTGAGELTAEVAATIGKTEFDVENGHGVLERIESRDFLILVADLVLDGQATPPKQGDFVNETNGNVTHVYEVLAPGGAPHFRYADPYRKTYRIHTKLIDELSS